MKLADIRAFLDGLNHEYLDVHLRKEELYWATSMGTSRDHEGFAAAETSWKDWISAPERLAAVRERLAAAEAAAPAGPAAAAEREELVDGLRGWLRLFSTNIVEGVEARRGMRRLIELEAELSGKRQSLVLRHVGERGEEEAGLSMLAVNLNANPLESSRRSSLEALRGLEEWVLRNGFLEIVRARNEFARGQGARDFFDYKLRKSEAMTPEELFAILDEFEARTREANARGLRAIAAKAGASGLEPWNLRFNMGGDLARAMDPYFGFAGSLARWVESFRRLGISFRGASLQLDLLDRAGKQGNGFCHGPVPSFMDRGTWVPARVNFTANCRPGQVGAGKYALETLFHEGGHAAHFANITRNAPCFSQEFPPSSMALAETQSLFCDTLLGDADWLLAYAKDGEGQPMPEELIRGSIELAQPFKAFEERAILVVSVFERDLYALPDTELRGDRVLALARETERRVLGLESPRPLLAIPHLLSQEWSASYHGYLLAHMAVYQTRAWFLRELGSIVDNPAVGPLLSRHYWEPGNAVSHDQSLRNLSGEGFTARHLADECALSPEEAWRAAAASLEAARSRSRPREQPGSLDARISVVDGERLIADNSVSEEAMCAAFAAEVERRLA